MVGTSRCIGPWCLSWNNGGSGIGKASGAAHRPRSILIRGAKSMVLALIAVPMALISWIEIFGLKCGTLTCGMVSIASRAKD